MSSQTTSSQPTSSQPTLKDVAERAGVSYQTVSKVLRKEKRVTPETLKRIEKAVAELDYRPNVAARSLRTRTTRLIGYSWNPTKLNEINPILEQFLNSVVNAAATLGYRLLLFPYDVGQDWLSSYQELILSNHVDAFILSEVEYEDPRVAHLQEMKASFVAFGHCDAPAPFSYVDVDNRQGGRMVTEHLLAQGHRKIAALAWPETSRIGAERLAGYREALHKAGIEVDPATVVRGAGTYQSGYDCASHLLDLPVERRPTAFVTMVDTMAIGAVHAAQQRGLRIGPDIGITGFDDTPIIQHLKPSLTSVRQPIAKVGEALVELLSGILQGDTPADSHVLLAPSLSVRESSLRHKPEYSDGQSTR